PLRADLGEQIPREPVADVVRRWLSPEAAHMTDLARRRGEVLHAQTTGPLPPVPLMSLGVVENAVGRLFVDLPLRMIRADVAPVAGLRLAGLLERIFVPEVTRGTIADAAVRTRSAHLVAADARELRDRIALDVKQRVARRPHKSGRQLAAARIVTD